MFNTVIRRGFLFIILMSYAFLLHYTHITYLNEQQYAPIFDGKSYEVIDILLIIVYLYVISFLVPLCLIKASDIFVIILALFLYIPIVVFSLGESILNFNLFNLIIISLVSFIIISTPSLLKGSNNDYKNTNYKKVLFPLWLLFFVIIVAKYHDIMTFSSLSEIYKQRLKGAANSLFDGYLQTYFAYIFSLGLISTGLFKRSLIYIIFGFIGCLILYMIVADKTIFLMPLFILLVFGAVKSKKNFYWYFIVFLVAHCLYFFLIAEYGTINKFFLDFGFYHLARIVATPGLFTLDYYQYFSETGYTNFTHIKGFNLLFDPDPSLLDDPLFPQVGMIVARSIHGINSNSNANFLAMDGIAGFGLLGLLFVSVLLMLYLFVLNKVSSFESPEFVIPTVAPIAFILLNGSFFTMILSFGGGFWLIMFSYSYFNQRKKK